VTDQQTPPSLGPLIESFVRDIDSLAETLPLSMTVLQEVAKDATKRLMSFETERCAVTLDGEKRTVEVPLEHYAKWLRLMRRQDKLHLSRALIPRSILVALVSQYDAFLGRLLSTLYRLKPELLNASEKSLTYSELLTYPTVEAIRDHLIEKEVESVLRTSHADQFRWLETRFDLPLRKGLASWPVFVELTERRNLFVHADGFVSGQYLAVCKSHGVALDSSTEVGRVLEVPQQYFVASYRCVFELGVKLAHVLWRKLFPEQRKDADNNLNNVAYDLLGRREYALASILLDFACEILKNYSDEWHRLVFIVNRGQAYKWGGEPARCLEVLAGEDWSAKGDDFRLAVAVLHDDWKAAADAVRRLGATNLQGLPRTIEYRDWPLFREFRKRSEFLEAYAAVFNEPFPTSVRPTEAPKPEGSAADPSKNGDA
jgi:hypothetical protein